MGQTQILMIVLSVIIVGIAVAVGITQCGESAVQANEDAVLANCQRVISSAAQWYRKPTSMGGDGRSFTGISLATLNMAASDDVGSYDINGSGTDLEVVGVGLEPNSDGNVAQVNMDYDATDSSTSIAITKVAAGTTAAATAS